MREYYGSITKTDCELYYLKHYGTKRHSGRYPWGSGKEPYQHSTDFLSRVEELKKGGMKETEIAKYFGLTTSKMRTQISLAKSERRSILVDKAKRLRDKEGMGATEIGRKLGLSESTVRSLLNTNSEKNMNKASDVADFLKKRIEEKGMLDVGAGVEHELGISREKLNEALYILEREGYNTYGGRFDQVNNPGKKTTMKVVTPPGTEHKDIFDLGKINSVRDYDSIVEEQTKKNLVKDPKPAKPDHFVYPSSMNPNRLQVCYAEEGGIKKDGLIEIRRGVEDLSLGKSHYAQVRIMVDNPDDKDGKKLYLKGMCAYADDLPDGVDVRFNTNKSKGTPVSKVLKEVKDDPKNPFGALIKEGGQSYYYDKNGKQHLSLINKRAEEGDWGEWADVLPSQFLAKQPKKLIKQQLNLTKANKYAEYEEINNLTNPTVKKLLLNKFAEDCDSAAVHLKAAALPRQKYQVIFPIPELSENEIYAPNYKNGEKVALVRFPHGGRFEIPIVTVNNKHKKAKSILGNALDAIGLNYKVAEQLSGADFDGDTALVLPLGTKAGIKNMAPLEGLKDFDPKAMYPERPGMKVMKATGVEMGKISNLITDMTIKGANAEELARAVRHSMVVIDAEKHHLDYKQSEKDNRILELKQKYQAKTTEDGKVKYGASTLLSRSKGEISVEKRRGTPWINPETGALEWERINPKTGEFETKYTGETRTITKVNKKTGETTSKTVKLMQKSERMKETNDAFTLSSGSDVETLYAEYANSMKALANKSRKSMIDTPNLKANAEAKKEYAEEVAQLKSALNIALRNKPKERRAQMLTNDYVKQVLVDNPDLKDDKKQLKKLRQTVLNEKRLLVGAKREPINITDRQWEAIQKGAITENVLMQILNNSDIDRVRALATPKEHKQISDVKIQKIKALEKSGYTTGEIADMMNLSASTIHKYIKE